MSISNMIWSLAAEVTEMLQRMRAGSLMNYAGGTTGGRLQLSNACLIKEPAFFDSVCNDFFRSGPTCHFELFPSTAKSIEASSLAAPHSALLAPPPPKDVRAGL